ncbi:MAG: hypothetical protein JXA75_01470 [Candidatus Thermoplasmatota archaeon]|nr:hypothetical protein [Candidatus Thermoplasmatota archaeon]
MKTILRRKDNTSICCPGLEKHYSSPHARIKVIEGTLACALLVVGLFIIIFSS